MIIKSAILLTLLFSINCLLAEELSINSFVDRTTIGLEDNLRYTIEISGQNASQVNQPELPEIKGFSNQGVSTSSSSSYSIVGGRMTSSVTRSFIYTLKPRETGVFLIPPITVHRKNQNLVTDPIRITIIEGTVDPPPVSRQLRDTAPQSEEQVSENIFIVAELSKNRLYRGEPLIVDYKLYSRYDLANLLFEAEPNFTGFWKDDLFVANRMNFQRANHQGRVFNVMSLRTVALYANQSGQLSIPSLGVTVDIVVRARSFFDFDSTRKLRLESEAKTVSVQDLPLNGRPDNFSGAVGNFTIKTDLNQREFRVGDTATYTLTINGSGNLKHFSPPAFLELPFLRHIDPEVQTETNLQRERNQISGWKRIRYPLIMTREGEYEIPPFAFSYFDPVNERYQSIVSSSYKVIISQNDLVALPTRVAQQDVTTDATDIHYIFRTTELSNPNYLIENKLYWLFWILTLLSIPFALYYRTEKEKMSRDSGYLRQKQADKILRKYLQQASNAAKNGDYQFYAYMNRGLTNYLTDTLRIPRGSTNEAIVSTLIDKGFPTEAIAGVKHILNRIVEARFKPGGTTSDTVKQDYEKLKQTIAILSRVKKRTRN